MPNANGSKKHDEKVCGIDPQTDCPTCRPHTIQRIKIERLMERLEKANIDVDVLADLIWLKLEDGVEKVIERIAQEKVSAAMKRSRIHATVDFTTFD